METNLVVTFKAAGDAAFQIRSVARIYMDGSGSLTIYDPTTGAAEMITLADVESLVIQAVGPVKIAA
jgi:hypothetical protein